MSRLAFLLPGDPGTLTGGYIYDRRILHGLRALGWTVDLVLLDHGFALLVLRQPAERQHSPVVPVKRSLSA